MTHIDPLSKPKAAETLDESMLEHSSVKLVTPLLPPPLLHTLPLLPQVEVQVELEQEQLLEQEEQGLLQLPKRRACMCP